MSITQGKAVAVLGGGNGGFAMAADLAARGHAVNLYEHPDFENGFRAILENPVIRMSGALGEKDSRAHLATTDLRAAIAAVDLINVVVPSTAQELFFQRLRRRCDRRKRWSSGPDASERSSS